MDNKEIRILFLRIGDLHLYIFQYISTLFYKEKLFAYLYHIFLFQIQRLYEAKFIIKKNVAEKIVRMQLTLLVNNTTGFTEM